MVFLDPKRNDSALRHALNLNPCGNQAIDAIKVLENHSCERTAQNGVTLVRQSKLQSTREEEPVVANVRNLKSAKSTNMSA